MVLRGARQLRCREHLVKAAARHGLKLRQNYNCMAPRLANRIERLRVREAIQAHEKGHCTRCAAVVAGSCVMWNGISTQWPIMAARRCRNWSIGQADSVAKPEEQRARTHYKLGVARPGVRRPIREDSRSVCTLDPR